MAPNTNTSEAERLQIEELKQEGFVPVGDGRIEIFCHLSEFLKDYFHKKEDFSGFVKRNGNSGLEIMKIDRSEGYVFVGPLQLERDYMARMARIRQWYEASGKKIIDTFTDAPEELAGFYWRKNPEA